MSFSLSLLLCLAVLLMWPVQGGFYEDLGLTEDATESDIKKSFRKLSRKLHPDHNPSADAKERYQRIQKAYGVLGDRKKKKIYDMMGEEGLKELEDSQRNTNQGMDIFGQLFGGGGGQDRGKGQDVRMRLKVSLDDIYNGNTHTVTYAKQKLRSKAVVKDCLKCKSQPPVMKRVQIAPGFVVQQQVAPPCDHVCSGGAKQVQKGYQQTLEVFIEKGIPEGHQLTYEMEADEYPDRLPGDIIFNVQSAPHPVFTRSGDDLLMTQHISLLEALVGFKKSVTHMDGHTVEIARKTVTPPRFQISIPNEGMPKHNVPSEKGKLIVTFEVDFPSSITAEQAKAFKDILR